MLDKSHIAGLQAGFVSFVQYLFGILDCVFRLWSCNQLGP